MRNAAHQTRANRTITIDFHNEATYFQLLGDGKAFVECVLAFLLALGFPLAHKAACRGGGCLTSLAAPPAGWVVSLSGVSSATCQAVFTVLPPVLRYRQMHRGGS
jgi:hypothetical protein